MTLSKNSRILCVIPARGGSKRVPRKNLKPVAGRPLLLHAIEYAMHSVSPMRIMVSTEDPEIASVARDSGAEVIDRPPELATDTAMPADVLFHALWEVESDSWTPEIVVALQPCIRRAEGLVETAVTLLRQTGCDGVTTVVRAQSKHPDWSVELFDDHRVLLPARGFPSRRQDLRAVYHFAGACFCSRRESLVNGAQTRRHPYWFLGEDIRALVLEEDAYVDIDTPLDIKWAEFLLAHGDESWMAIPGRLGATS